MSKVFCDRPKIGLGDIIGSIIFGLLGLGGLYLIKSGLNDGASRDLYSGILLTFIGFYVVFLIVRSYYRDFRKYMVFRKNTEQYEAMLEKEKQDNHDEWIQYKEACRTEKRFLCFIIFGFVVLPLIICSPVFGCILAVILFLIIRSAFKSDPKTREEFEARKNATIVFPDAPSYGHSSADHCPGCGSGHVRQINTMEKVWAYKTFGASSYPYLNSTYECEICHHRW